MSEACRGALTARVWAFWTSTRTIGMAWLGTIRSPLRFPTLPVVPFGLAHSLGRRRTCCFTRWGEMWSMGDREVSPLVTVAPCRGALKVGAPGPRSSTPQAGPSDPRIQRRSARR